MPALWPGSYGTDSYLRAFIPAVERYGSALEFVVLVTNGAANVLVSRQNVTYVRVPAPGWTGRHLRTLWEQYVLPRFLDRLDVDVVYTARNIGLLRSRTPCVIAVRNIDPLVPKVGREALVLRFNSALRGALSRASLRESKRIVAVSEYVKNVIVRLGADPAKIDVIYHGIDDIPLLPDPEPAPVSHVAAVSKYIRYANLTTLVKAFHRMRECGFTGELQLAGGSLDRRYEKEVRALVRRLGLDLHIRFLGYVSRERVQRMLRASAVVLHASKLEACPFTLLEAMRQEAAIVTTTAGPMREICGEAALYVDPDDADAFGHAAWRVASSPELREELRVKARARAATFRWEDSVRGLAGSLARASCGS